MRIKGLKSQEFHISDNGDGICGDRAKRRVMNKNLGAGWRNGFVLWGLTYSAPPEGTASSCKSAPARRSLEPLRNARYDKPPNLRRTHEFLVLLVQYVLRRNRKAGTSQATQRNIVAEVEVNERVALHCALEYR